jgi:hypothetical protein
VTRSCARLAALLLLFGLVSAGAAPCLCAAAPAAVADHCGAPAPGLSDAHDACACPCMTSASGLADRPELEPRVAPAALAAAAPQHLPHSVLVLPAPRATGAPERATASPPTVLRI